MGVGNIFVATTLAPVVVLFASVSLNLFTIGLEKLAICERSPCPVSEHTKQYEYSYTRSSSKQKVVKACSTVGLQLSVQIVV